MIKILFVDDEVNVLRALKRLLMDTEYECDFAIGGKEAIDKINNNDYAIVVSDMRMPEIDGIEVLRTCQEKNSNTVPIILTGYSDQEKTIQAINEGKVWKFISKPWNEMDLFVSLQNAACLYWERQKVEELNEELSIKNLELKKFNLKLEEMVKSRTEEITLRAETLQLMLEHNEIDFALGAFLNKISQKIKSQPMELTPAWDKNFTTTQGLPIIRNNEEIGRLKVEQYSQLNEEAKGYLDRNLSIFSVGLSLVRGIKNHDQLVTEVDDLLDVLGN